VDFIPRLILGLLTLATMAFTLCALYAGNPLAICYYAAKHPELVKAYGKDYIDYKLGFDELEAFRI